MTLSQQLTQMEMKPETSAWGRFWRATVPTLEPTCDSDICRSLKRDCQEHQTIEGEWEQVFDAFADLEIVNKVIVGAGEGAGKTHHDAVFGVVRSQFDRLMLGRPGLYWIIGADYEDAYDPCFKYILEHGYNLDNVADKNEPKNGRDQCRLLTNDGIEFITVSAKDPQKIARQQPDGFILEEASRFSTEAFERIYTRSTRKPNAWILGSGSFETSRGPFANRFREGTGANLQRVVSFSMPSWSNRHVYPGGADDPRIQERRVSMSPDRFAERVEGRPANPRGAVLGAFRRELHVNPDLKYDPALPTYLFIDPGTTVYAVLFVQIAGPEIRVLEELYAHNIDHKTIISQCQVREGWRFLTPSGNVMDFAGRQQHFGNPSAWDSWKKSTGISFRTTKSQVEVDNKVEAVISLLNVNPETGRPFLQIHPRCTGIISEAGAGESPLAELGVSGMWMRRVDSNTGEVGEVVSKNDHAWSALAYGRIVHFGTNRPSERVRPTRRTRSYMDSGAPPRTGSTRDVLEAMLSGRRPARRRYW